MSKTIRRCLAMAAVLAGGCGLLPSAAQAADGFSCRASALRVSTLINLEPFVANDQKTPCKDDSSGLLSPTTLGPVTVSLLDAKTSDDSGAKSDASVAKLKIGIGGLLGLGINVIEADLLATSAGATCAGGKPVFNSSSTIAKLKINGNTVINLDQEGSIPILVGTIYLNEKVTTANSVTRRALRVSIPLLLDVVVSESVAQVDGKPCAPPPQCSDKIDNDNDGDVDFPDDEGCTAPDDDDETNPVEQPDCSDGDDNDGDGKIDYPADKGCTSPADDDESNDDDDPGPVEKPECSNGKDDDGDKKIDYPKDPGCSSPADDDETNAAPKPQCSDGKDNDGDKKIDYPKDPGCKNPADNNEYNKPKCKDGKDNDGDRKADYPKDPGCSSAKDDDEKHKPKDDGDKHKPKDDGDKRSYAAMIRQ